MRTNNTLDEGTCDIYYGFNGCPNLVFIIAVDDFCAGDLHERNCMREQLVGEWLE